MNAHDSNGMANFIVIDVKNSNICGWLKVVHAVSVGFGAARDGGEMVGVASIVSGPVVAGKAESSCHEALISRGGWEVGC